MCLKNEEIASELFSVERPIVLSIEINRDF